MEMSDIVREYVEERLFEIQDTTGLSFMLCSQSFGGTLHACLSQCICEDMNLDDREIESMMGEYFRVDSYHFGGIYFNLFPDDWDNLQRRLKIQMILEE